MILNEICDFDITVGTSAAAEKRALGKMYCIKWKLSGFVFKTFEELYELYIDTIVMSIFRLGFTILFFLRCNSK